MTEEPPRALREVDRLNRNRENVANVGYGEDLGSSRSGIARRAEDQVMWQQPSCEDRKAHLVQLEARPSVQQEIGVLGLISLMNTNE